MDDYYPFGLTFNSFKREDGKGNNFLYNEGTERITDLDLGWDMTANRIYLPDLGRFLQVDRLADTPIQLNQTPYQYAWNNPIKYNDPTGDCPCLIPALPWIYAGLEAAFYAGSAYYVYLNQDDFFPDQSQLTARTLKIHNEAGNYNFRDPKRPNFDTSKKVALIGTAIGLVARLAEKTGKAWDQKQMSLTVEGMSENDLETFIRALQGGLRSDELLTDRQYFGKMNPLLLESATTYDLTKGISFPERGLSSDEKKAEEEQNRKGQKASQLLNSPMNELSEGTYTWNGSNWVN